MALAMALFSSAASLNSPMTLDLPLSLKTEQNPDVFSLNFHSPEA